MRIIPFHPSYGENAARLISRIQTEEPPSGPPQVGGQADGAVP